MKQPPTGKKRVPRRVRPARRRSALPKSPQTVPTNVDGAKARSHVTPQSIANTKYVLQQLRDMRRELMERTAALAALQKELGNEHVRYAELFNMTPDGYLVTDPFGVIREANRSVALMLGIPLPHLRGKPIINFVEMADRQNLRQHLIQLRGPDSKPGPGRKVEFVRLVPRGKEPIEISLRIAAIRHEKTHDLTGARWLLRDMGERLQAETERHQLLVDAVEDYAIFLLDEAGYINSWNQGAQHIFGYTEAEVVGKAYSKLFPDELGNVAEQELALARARGRALEEEWMRRKNGERFFTQGVLLALPSGGANGRAGFAKILRDVTERRQMEEELRLRETRMTLALEAAHAGTWQWDLDTDKMTWSNDYRQICCIDQNAPPTYESWKGAVHPDDLAGAEKVIADSIRTGAPIVNEYRVANPAQKGEMWLLSFGHAIADETGRVYRLLGITMDITERKLAEVRLETRVEERTQELAVMNRALQAEIAEREQSEEVRRELTRRLATAQEEERRRISLELHDHMGQLLTAFALSLRVLEESYPPDAKGRSLLDRLRQEADQLGREMHRLAVELRPPAIDELGLSKALNGYLDTWSERTGIQTDFHATGFTENERLPEEIEVPLYRIAQESLNNVARHSGASRVSMLLNRQMEQIVLVVEDNGHGFDVEAVLRPNSVKPTEKQRLGLLGMQERVQLIGGTFTIESQHGQGTTLFIRVPCPPGQPKDEAG